MSTTNLKPYTEVGTNATSEPIYRWHCPACNRTGRWSKDEHAAGRNGGRHAGRVHRDVKPWNAPPSLFANAPRATLLDIDPDEYHQRDGLSSSIAKTIVTRSPLHAWNEHPRFGAQGKEPTPEMDLGTIVHALVLGKGKRFEILDYADYKTKEAREKRDAARGVGFVPILKHQHEQAKEIAARVLAELERRRIVLDGRSEVAIEWHEDTEVGPVLCRGMFDHVWLDRGVILDLKITGDAKPDTVERQAENLGYAIQAAAYTRAITALRPELAGRVDFLFAFCERDKPFAVNLSRPDGAFRELGERRWLRAVEVWAACLKTQRFPAYGEGVNFISPPAWVLAREGYF